MPKEQPMAEVIQMMPRREDRRIIECLFQILHWMKEQEKTFENQGEVTRLFQAFQNLLERTKTAEPAYMWGSFETLVTILMEISTAPPAGSSQEAEQLRAALAAAQAEHAKTDTAASAISATLHNTKQKQQEAVANATALGEELRNAMAEVSRLKTALDSATRSADTSDRLRQQAIRDGADATRREDALKTENQRLRTQADAKVRAFEQEIAERQQKDATQAAQTQQVVSAALAQMQAGLSAAMKLLPGSTPQAAPVTDLSALEKEIDRREKHLGSYMGVIEQIRTSLEELEEENAAAQIRGDTRQMAQNDAKRMRMQTHAAKLNSLYQGYATMLQQLKSLLTAHQRVARGPAADVMSAILPFPPALEEVATEELLPESPSLRLASLAKVYKMSGDIMLLITAFDLVAPGNMGIPRIVRALQEAGVMAALKPERLIREGLRFHPDKDDRVWQQLMRYSGNPNAGQGSMTFRRSIESLPWRADQIFSPALAEAFLTAVAKKSNT